LRGKSRIPSLPRMSRADFALVRSYALNEALRGELVRYLAQRLKA
jgi:hypothetical protein